MIPCNAYSSCKLYRLRLTVLMGRNGAEDATSSLNIGEEYHTSERMVNVLFVYMLNCHGEPLMPCQPRKARLLLQEGKARFLNRNKPKGWLAPSVQHKVDCHMKTIRLVHSILPVRRTTIEVAQFDVQKIRNPEIEGEEYQGGPQLGFWNVR